VALVPVDAGVSVVGELKDFVGVGDADPRGKPDVDMGHRFAPQ
jgi:hypothetical protein